MKDPMTAIKLYAGIGDELCFKGVTTDLLNRTKKLPIFKEILHLKRTGDPATLTWLLTVCYHGKKIHWRDPQRKADALRAWIEADEALVDVSESSTSELKEIIDVMLSDHGASEDFWPRHGPGSTADVGRSVVKKTQSIEPDAALRFAFREGVGLFHYPMFDSTAVMHLQGGGERDIRVSELSFAPKNLWVYRSICAESATIMWYQQGVAESLQRRMADSEILWFVRLKDQGWNRRLCLESSKDLKSSTIDLSRASDTVSLALVKRIFPRRWLYYMLATRSNRTKLPDGSLYIQRKFAPMGSALCFPTQCIIFAAIVLRSYLRLYRSLRKIPNNCTYEQQLRMLARFLKRDGAMIGVFGDDIICDNTVVDDVLASLRSLNFVPNESKSCLFSAPVRESCGIYAYQGHDVTPVYYRYPIKERRGPIGVSQWYQTRVSYINRLRDHGYHQAARVAFHLLESDPSLKALGWNHFHFSSNRDDSCALYSKSPRNACSRRRFFGESTGMGTHVRFQRDEIQRLQPFSRVHSVGRTSYSGLKPKSARKVDPTTVPSEEWRYYEWHRATRKRKAVEIRPSEYGDAIPAKLRWRWEPVGE
jgi:hypothetical protein